MRKRHEEDLKEALHAVGTMQLKVEQELVRKATLMFEQLTCHPWARVALNKSTRSRPCELCP